MSRYKVQRRSSQHTSPKFAKQLTVLVTNAATNLIFFRIIHCKEPNHCHYDTSQIRFLSILILCKSDHKYLTEIFGYTIYIQVKKKAIKINAKIEDVGLTED